MNRATSIAVCVVVCLALASSPAVAQGPMVTVGAGFGGYGPGMAGFGYGYGYAPVYGGFGGFAPGLGYGYGNLGYGMYGPFAFSQQMFRQQALLTQGVFLQQQQALLGQIDTAQERLEKLDATKQQLFRQYLDMNDDDKQAVRAGLIEDYLKLDARGREGWKRDAVVERIVGQDLLRLDGVAEFRALSPTDQASFRRALLDKYAALPADEREKWRQDKIIELILGSKWSQQ